jgi:hypothetical protein
MLPCQEVIQFPCAYSFLRSGALQLLDFIRSDPKKRSIWCPFLLTNPKLEVRSQPDLTIICNARGYLSLLEHYSKTTDIPLLVLTGAGPDLIGEVKGYTPHVLAVPFRMQNLYYKIEEVLG